MHSRKGLGALPPRTPVTLSGTLMEIETQPSPDVGHHHSIAIWGPHSSSRCCLVFLTCWSLSVVHIVRDELKAPEVPGGDGS